MICPPCQRGDHEICEQVAHTDPDTQVVTLRQRISPTQCDCQHVTEGTCINPAFLPKPEKTDTLEG